MNEGKLFFSVPYFGKSSQLFTKQLSRLTANLITVKLIPIRTKRLKLAIILILNHVLLRLWCPMLSIGFHAREADLIYIGKSARRLVTRVKEYWALNSITQKSALKEYNLDCNNCVKSDDILKPFSILRKCTLDYVIKIHEALYQLKNTNPNSTGSYMEMALRSC